MNQEQWNAVEQYTAGLLAPHDEHLEAALRASDEAGLPPIQVAPNEGKLLMMLAQVVSATRILEIGTLGGYSTIWLARALPLHGRLITIEAEPKHAEVARANIVNAGLADQVDVRLGPALDLLQKIEREQCGPFDLIFIDADKENTPHYFEWALKLSRLGSLIIVDNVVREGELADAASDDPRVRAMRRLCGMIANEPRVSGSVIQTVGSKGYDGFAIALVTAGE